MIGLAEAVAIGGIDHTVAMRLRTDIGCLDVIDHINHHDKSNANCCTDDGNSTKKGILPYKCKYLSEGHKYIVL